MRKIGRAADPLRKAEAAGKIGSAGRTLAQFYHDVTLDTDVDLKGKTVPGGKATLSEMEGEVVFRWELWSNKKDQTVVNTSAMKRIADPKQREDFANKLMDQISVQ